MVVPKQNMHRMTSTARVSVCKFKKEICTHNCNSNRLARGTFCTRRGTRRSVGGVRGGSNSLARGTRRSAAGVTYTKQVTHSR